jgi:glycosyltransferase involved in cell wall biosynthesis
MSAVESLAAGKPVIGVAEGGLPEIIRDPENGLLLQPGFSLEDLVAAVAWMSPAQAARMRNDCRHRAEMFGASRFINDIRERLC